MKVKSPAKLNLHLEVIKKRTDGFHELRTVFQLIDLYDEIEFKFVASLVIILKKEEQNQPQSSKDVPVNSTQPDFQ